MESTCNFVYPHGHMMHCRCNLPVSANNRCEFHDHIIFSNWDLERVATHGIGEDNFELIYQWILDHPNQFEEDFYDDLMFAKRGCVLLLLCHIENLDTYPPEAPSPPFNQAPHIIPQMAQLPAINPQVVENQLHARSYNDDYYIILEGEFIISPPVNGKISVVGKHDKELLKCIPLTEQDEIEAKKNDFIIAAYVEVIPNSTAIIQQVPKIPLINPEVVVDPNSVPIIQPEIKMPVINSQVVDSVELQVPTLNPQVVNSITDNKVPILTVKKYSDGHYIMIEYGFIVSVAALKLSVVGKHDEELAKCVPLTEQDEIEAKKLGLIIAPYMPIVPL